MAINVINENDYNFKINDIHKLNDMEYLTGPLTFAILKSENCTCITVGDAHVSSNIGFNTNNKDKEIYLPEYLDMLFRKYPDKQFDLLIELQYTKYKMADDVEYQNGIINNVYKSFKVCFIDLQDKVACSKKWPNVRFHAIDIRYIHNNEINNLTNDVSLINLMKIERHWKRAMHTSDLPIPTKTYQSVIDFIEVDLKILFILNKNNKFVENTINIINQYYKFARYQNLADMNIIIEYIKNRLYSLLIINNVFEYFNNLKNSEIKNMEKLNNYVMRLSNFLLDLRCIVFDYYMLLRFLKITKYNATNKNIIVIAGDEHIKNLEYFLQYELYNFEYVVCKGKNIIPMNKYLQIKNKLKRMIEISDLDNAYKEINTSEYMVIERIISLLQNYFINNMDANNLDSFKKIFGKLVKYKNYINTYISYNNDHNYSALTNPENRYIIINSLEIENNIQ